MRREWRATDALARERLTFEEPKPEKGCQTIISEASPKSQYGEYDKPTNNHGHDGHGVENKQPEKNDRNHEKSSTDKAGSSYTLINYARQLEPRGKRPCRSSLLLKNWKVVA